MTPNPTAAIVRARLAELEAILASGETISGQPARGLVLPPYDEDPDIERRIALYRRWLARHAQEEGGGGARRRSEAMHECPACGQACDCDLEDTWIDSNAADCTHGCEEDDDSFDDGLEDDLDMPIRRCIDLNMEYPTIVCLCGSTRFWREFQAASLRETMTGRIVLSIGAESGTDDEHFGNLPRAEYDRIKAELDALHMRKIDLCDEVLILNCGKYIGESTARELAYARQIGKVVRFLEDPE